MTHFFLAAIICVLLGMGPMMLFCFGWWVLDLDD